MGKSDVKLLSRRSFNGDAVGKDEIYGRESLYQNHTKGKAGTYGVLSKYFRQQKETKIHRADQTVNPKLYGVQGLHTISPGEY